MLDHLGSEERIELAVPERHGVRVEDGPGLVGELSDAGLDPPERVLEVERGSATLDDDAAPGRHGAQTERKTKALHDQPRAAYSGPSRCNAVTAIPARIMTSARPR